MKRFAGRSVMVTGAASGIGAAVAGRLLAEGATVIALDCDSSGLEALAAELRSDKVKLHAADITDREHITSLVSRIDEQYPLDGLVNAAGVMEAGPFEQMSAQAWLRLFEINVHGTFHVSQSVARCMLARHRGAIVSVASNAATTPRVNLSGYCASKAAVAMLTRCMGLELGRQGVRCNVVSPGSTRTPMLHQLAGHDETLTGAWSRATSACIASASRLARSPNPRTSQPESLSCSRTMPTTLPCKTWSWTAAPPLVECTS